METGGGMTKRGHSICSDRLRTHGPAILIALFLVALFWMRR
jgi:hypothetical protein